MTIDDDYRRLEELKTLALNRAFASKDIADVEKAAAVVKTLADSEKAANDNKNYSKMVRNEWYKTLATTVVPLLTLFTLVVTIYLQNEQLGITRKANDDAAWRDTAEKVLAQIKPPGLKTAGVAKPNDAGLVEPGVYPDPLLAIQLLRPWFRDPTHGAEAVDLGILVLSRTQDVRLNTAFFASPDVQVTAQSAGAFLNRQREIWAYVEALDSNPYLARIWNAQDRETARQSSYALMRMICGKIADAIKAQRLATLPKDLNSSVMFGCDFQRANFGKANLAGARFEHVNLSSADLGSIQEFKDSSWYDVNWWDARYVDGKLLDYLQVNYYPYASSSFWYESPPPNAVDYRRRIKELCSKARVECPESKIWYGPRPQGRAKDVMPNVTLEAAKLVLASNLTDRVLTSTAADSHETYSPLVASRLCSVLSAADMEKERKNADANGQPLVYGVRCNEDYGYLRDFLLDAAISHHRIRQDHSQAPVPYKLAQVLEAMAGISASSLGYVLENDHSDQSVVWTTPPTAEEMRLFEGLQSVNLCQVMSKEQLHQAAIANKKPKFAYSFGVVCSEDYGGVRSYVVDDLLPAVWKELK